jgi:hypothetical protein
MVDPEKIKKRKEKKKGNDESKESESKKEEIREKGKNKQSKQSPRSTDYDGDVKRLMFVLGNIYLYPRTMSGFAKSQMSGKGKKVLTSVASDISSESLDFMGVFGVQQICDEYGYDFDEITDQISGGDKYGKNYMSNEDKVDGSDVKDLLDCIANCLLYVEGIMRKVEDNDSPDFREEKSAEVAEMVYGEYKEIISTLGVQKIAEKSGYSWKDDIIKGVLEEQDYDDLIERKWG